MYETKLHVHVQMKIQSKRNQRLRTNALRQREARQRATNADRERNQQRT